MQHGFYFLLVFFCYVMLVISVLLYFFCFAVSLLFMCLNNPSDSDVLFLTSGLYASKLDLSTLTVLPLDKKSSDFFMQLICVAVFLNNTL